MTNSRLKLGIAVSLSILLVGCSKEPPPPKQEPIPPPAYVPPPKPLAPAPAWDAMIDQATESLSRDLPDLPAIQAANAKQVLALAPMRGPASQSTAQQEGMRQSLLLALSGNQRIRGSFVVISVDKTDAESALRDFGTSPQYQLQSATGDGSPAGRYDPRSIYFISVTLVDGPAGADEQISRLFVKVEHPQSRELVYSKEVRQRATYDPASNAWVRGGP